MAASNRALSNELKKKRLYLITLLSRLTEIYLSDGALDFQYGRPPAIDPVFKWALFFSRTQTGCSTSSFSWQFRSTFDGRHWLPFPYSTLLMLQRMRIAYFFVRTHRGHKYKNKVVRASCVWFLFFFFNFCVNPCL